MGFEFVWFSMKPVSVTLWAALAETVGNELETALASEPPTALFKNVRVNSYNGISLASVNRTEVEINPDLAEAHQLHDWYELIGKTETMIPLSEGMPNARQRLNASFYFPFMSRVALWLRNQSS